MYNQQIDDHISKGYIIVEEDRKKRKKEKRKTIAPTV